MNNARTHSAVQTTVPNPNPGWNTSSDCIGYDGAGRMITKRYLIGGINSSNGAYNNSTPVVGFTTSFDPSSNKLFEFDLHAPTRSHLYPAYDSADRLLQYQRGQFNSSTGPILTPIALPNTDYSRTYNYDGLGNWKNTAYIPIESNGSEGALTTDVRRHNSTNELTQWNPTGLSPVNVSYDHGNNYNNPNPLIAARGNGNIINDGTRKYTFDALNRPVQVFNQSGGQIAAYGYDALNRRVSKDVTGGGITGTVPNVSTTYFYDGNQCLEERNSGTTSRQFVWGQYVDEMMQLKTLVTLGAQNLSAGSYYPLSDTLYRTTALTNTSGGIVEAYDTDAYGNTLIFSAPGTGGNWWANNATQASYSVCENIFTGQQYDAETQIYFYDARYYHLQLGRFISLDPIGYRGGINLYEYVYSNPTFAVDPSGTGGSGKAITQMAHIRPRLCLKTAV
jgi:RHS repeat-associated protein